MTKKRRLKMATKVALASALFILLAVGSAAWLFGRATTVSRELQAAAALAPQLKSAVSSNDVDRAASITVELRGHTEVAKEAVDDPVWGLAEVTPLIGQNFSAVSEVAQSANDIAVLGVSPLVEVFESLDWNKLIPGNADVNLEDIQEAAPRISSAEHAIRESHDRLQAISLENLVPQVSEPLEKAQAELASLVPPLTAAAQTSTYAPGMLGADGPRNYLLMVQNNAETRATGGIPGALAVLTFDDGRMTLSAQSSATEIGAMAPGLPVDEEQRHIYTTRLGKYMQDVNLTPDFPTAATTAKAMWERRFAQHIDGVISIDPVALSFILKATGPVAIKGPDLEALKASGLPTELTGANVVPTLLSEVYSKIPQPKLQDAYFAAVAQETFTALSKGTGESTGLIAGLTQGVQEGRIRIWSSRADEQATLSAYAIGGAIVGPSISPTGFGVYFNDGTGAKMDYYIKRTVQLVKECPADGYDQIRVRVTSTNSAPSDAGTSLPAYVTGGGVFGIRPGTVQTNIAAYGPAQAYVESASVDGQKVPFAPYVHSSRPVGVVAQQLAPGESKTVEFVFGKIVQHEEPNVVVTPTVQPVKDVVLPTEDEPCGSGH